MAESVHIDDVESSEGEEDNISVDAIIWIDTNVSTEEENRKAHQELHNLFEEIEISVFQQSADCEEYVQQHSEKSFLIIVSRQLAQELIEKIHNLESIKFIYIYCHSQNWKEP
jgi:predicted regulator of amino acid metabolism with ACT domain